MESEGQEEGTIEHAEEYQENNHTLQVDISDALCEQEKVMFTVQTRKLQQNGEPVQKFKVVRTHEDFIWLHSVVEEERRYAGIIIPPRPTKPNFQLCQDRLDKLGEREARGGRRQFAKVKADLEAEYLAAFKKTVAQHENFLHRLVSHPILKCNLNLKIFLEYEEELGVRGKNVKEKISEFFNVFQRTGDELLLANNQKDGDAAFEAEKAHLLKYHTRLKVACIQADKMCSLHKALSRNYSTITSCLSDMAMDSPNMSELSEVCDSLEKVKRIEGRLANDQELKLADTLRFHVRDTQAAKELLYRRLRALTNFENANKELHIARARNRDKAMAEASQREAWATFEELTESAKEELDMQKERRVASFQKNLKDLAELEIKHSRAHSAVLKQAIASLKNED